jgi:hypothetical protein
MFCRRIVKKFRVEFLGNARVSRAFFGVPPKNRATQYWFDDGSGATPEPTRGTRVLPKTDPLPIFALLAKI